MWSLPAPPPSLSPSLYHHPCFRSCLARVSLTLARPVVRALWLPAARMSTLPPAAALRVPVHLTLARHVVLALWLPAARMRAAPPAATRQLRLGKSELYARHVVRVLWLPAARRVHHRQACAVWRY